MQPAVHQFASPQFVRSEIERFRTTQIVVSGLADVDNSAFSLFMNHHKGLSNRAQQSVFEVFDFLEALTDESAARGLLAPDLTDMSVLRPRWEKWREGRAEAEVIRTAGELRANGKSA